MDQQILRIQKKMDGDLNVIGTIFYHNHLLIMMNSKLIKTMALISCLYLRHIDSWLAGVLSVIAFLSPIMMVTLPKMNVVGFKESQMICNVECDGLLLSFSFKLIILSLGTWALFFRPSKVCIEI